LADRQREQAEFNDLTRNYQIADQNYRTYLQGVQQAHVDEDLNQQRITSVGIVAPASTPSSPAKPNIPLVIGLSILLGIVFSFIVGLIRESMDERINTPIQVGSVLGFPMLGSMGVLAEKTR
jgi:uncharacterized protein involved in exopolysaccharide biosynthesis